MEKESGFEALPLKRRILIKMDTNQYQVFGTSGERRRIEANTAYEAFRLSGFDEAIRIERVSNIRRILFDDSSFDAEASVSAPGTPPRHSVMSAPELEALMQTLADRANAQPPSAAAAPPAEAPAGLEVAGDGFDEIIPAAVLPRPERSSSEAPKTPAADMTTAPPPIPVPEQELSPEEVAKLLQSGES